MRFQQLLAKLLAENLTDKKNLGNIEFVEGKRVIFLLKKRAMIKLTWFRSFKCGLTNASCEHFSETCTLLKMGNYSSNCAAIRF
jgi:hypothetical protein